MKRPLVTPCRASVSAKQPICPASARERCVAMLLRAEPHQRAGVQVEVRGHQEEEIQVVGGDQLVNEEEVERARVEVSGADQPLGDQRLQAGREVLSTLDRRQGGEDASHARFVLGITISSPVAIRERVHVFLVPERRKVHHPRR
ncbi:MAG: hypothetical protein M5U28_05755 [Sandaracinaceae bacterium]|nr:hypothetical protein [Sandaracinaceae bacterium]